jgi:ribosomal protein L37E
MADSFYDGNPGFGKVSPSELKTQCPACPNSEFDLADGPCENCNWSPPNLSTSRVKNTDYQDSIVCDHCGQHLGFDAPVRCDECLIERGQLDHDDYDHANDDSDDTDDDGANDITVAEDDSEILTDDTDPSTQANLSEFEESEITVAEDDTDTLTQ